MIKFIKPDTYQVAIIDDFHSHLFNILCKNKKKIIIPIRNKIPIVVSLKFLIELFFFFIKKKSFKEIRKNYLKFVFRSLKIDRVLTFFDNTHRISLLMREFPKIKFFTFTNGTRVQDYNFKHDNLLTWGKIEKKMDKNKVFESRKYFPIGSLRLLNYLEQEKNNHKKKTKKIDILYISAFTSINNSSNINKYARNILNFEKKLIKQLIFLQKKKNYNFKILLKSLIKDKDFQNEQNYYKKLVSKECIIEKENYLNSYEVIDTSKITISLVSALGLEALCLDTKVLLGFSIKDIQEKLSYHSFFKYYNFNKCNIASLENLELNSLSKKISKLMKISNYEYKKKTKTLRMLYSNFPIKKKIIKIIYEI